MTDFAAIDFEIANWERSSVCSVGVVIYRGGRFADSVYRLIHPTPNWYWWKFTQIHGLTADDTAEEPEFPEVWADIAPLVKGLPLVANNSPFDEGCLRAVHNAYAMPWPDYHLHCTGRASRRVFGHELPNHQLHTVAEHCGFTLSAHHNALADAEACAAIASRIL